MKSAQIFIIVMAILFGAACAAHSVQLHRRGSPLNSFELAAYTLFGVALTVLVFGHR